MSDPTDVTRRLVARLPQDERTSLVPGPGERLVSLGRIDDPAWLAEQLRLRARIWSYEDERVLATLWWYSASAWTIGPTVTSLVLGEPILSARPRDLWLHWSPDSRITGATSQQVSDRPGDRLEVAAGNLRDLYEHVLPVLADHVGMRPRPLWAIAADALANRLLWLGRALGTTREQVDGVTSLLGPLIESIGGPLPRTGYTRTDDVAQMHTRRCSCCLLYLVPDKSPCSSCPRIRTTLRGASCS